MPAGQVLEAGAECRSLANSSTILAQNAGRSPGLRLVTRPWSATTSLSTQVPPALRMSVATVGKVRDAAADSFVLADGFSCRTQIEQAGTGRTPVHLAEILAAGLRRTGRSGAAQDELPLRTERPAPPGTVGYARLAGLGVAAAGATALLTRWLTAERRGR